MSKQIPHMTPAQIESLKTSIARFIAIGSPGRCLSLPFCTDMWKDNNGRMFMQHNGISWALYNETSDDIVAKLVRWSKKYN